MCPKGNSNRKGRDISIFIKLVDTEVFDHHEKVKANCSISLKDQINGGSKKLSCTENVYSFLFVSVASFLFI